MRLPWKTSITDPQHSNKIIIQVTTLCLFPIISVGYGVTVHCLHIAEPPSHFKEHARNILIGLPLANDHLFRAVNPSRVQPFPTAQQQFLSWEQQDNPAWTGAAEEFQQVPLVCHEQRTREHLATSECPLSFDAVWLCKIHNQAKWTWGQLWLSGWTRMWECV